MSQANQILPVSTQATASAGVTVSQPVENNANSGEGSRFSGLLKSEIAQKDTAKTPLGQTSQPGNTALAEGQELPQDGKLQPVSAGFHILNKAGLVAGLDLRANNQIVQTAQVNQSDISNSVLPEVFPEAEIETGSVTVTENPLSGTADSETTTQNTIIKQGTDESKVLTGLESEQVSPVAETNTPIPTESAKEISSRSALPEASVVGQQQAVESILKHSTTTSEGDTEIQPLPGNGREVPARLAALAQQQNNTASGNGQVAQEALQEDLDIERLMQEVNDGKKLLDSVQGKENTIRTVTNALGGVHTVAESAQNLTQSQNLNNLPGLQAVGAQPAQPGSTSNVTQSPVIDMPLKQQGWDEAMSQRVMWQINQKIQRADIRLNPPHLGPLEVRINMTDEGANVTFSSQHGAVRETVEAALPKLREMLEEQGINLANADVSEQSVAQQNHRGETGDDEPSNMTAKQLADEEKETRTVAVSDSMLDLFA